MHRYSFFGDGSFYIDWFDGLLFWFRISKKIIYIKIDSLVVVICFTSLQQKFHEFTPSKQGRML